MTSAAAPGPAPAPIAPDTRDWTFVIRDGCLECGFVPQDVEETGTRLRATIPQWQAVLGGPGRPDAGARPAPAVWSPLEYACHVRDVCRLFRRRLDRMLTEDDPEFANWDQDVSAVEDRYFEQSPAAVAEELAQEAEATAAAFDGVRADQWQRPGRRSNGSVFTVATFAVYFLHDVEHHVHDVTGG